MAPNTKGTLLADQITCKTGFFYWEAGNTVGFLIRAEVEVGAKFIP